MEYPFLSPPMRLNPANSNYSVPIRLCRNAYNRCLRTYYNSGGRPPEKWIEISKTTRFWKDNMQPFLEEELNKKLAFQGKTRQQWEEEQVLAREARRAEDNAVMAALQSQQSQKAAPEKYGGLESFRHELSFCRYWSLKLLGFKCDVRKTFKSIWLRKIERNLYRPRYFSSPSWMKFWLFLQEKILHPVRWKYSVAYQLLVVQQASWDLSESLYWFGYREDSREAEVLTAVWEEIAQKADAAEDRKKFWLTYRYDSHLEAFAIALAPLYEWEDAHQEAQKLKAKEEQGNRLVEVAKALGAATTGDALGGVH